MVYVLTKEAVHYWCTLIAHFNGLNNWSHGFHLNSIEFLIPIPIFFQISEEIQNRNRNQNRSSINTSCILHITHKIWESETGHRMGNANNLLVWENCAKFESHSHLLSLTFYAFASATANLPVSPIEFFTVAPCWQCWHYCQFCIPTYVQFSPLIVSTDVSTCKIRNQLVCEDYILRLNATFGLIDF